MKIISSLKWKYISYSLMIFAAMVFLFKSVNNYIISQRYAHIINKDMAEILKGYMAGYSPYQIYNGAYCVAVEKLGVAINKLNI